ncbi:MAG: hypothetical protein PHD09_06800 [Candidatus Omnitrophica bacterium]|nr:hypothetical protein [Candidatus Omnitrophota bacterium]
MKNQKFIPRKTARLIINIIMAFLVLFANFFAVKAMSIYAVEVIAYEKMSVAYNIGGIDGLKFEIDQILSHSQFKRELSTAKEFRDLLENLEEPGVYLQNEISERKNQVVFYNRMRRLSMVLIFILLGARIILNLAVKS